MARSHFPDVLDALPDALFLVDSEGHILSANHRCESLLGYWPQELVGCSIDSLVPERFQGHAALRRRYMDAPTLRPMGQNRRLVAIAKGGQEVPVDIALSPVTVDGEALVIAALRDARENHTLLQTLQLQSVALRAAGNGVVITDRTGVITWVNPAVATMTGYSAGELVGKSTSVLKSGHHDRGFYRELWDTVLAGKTWQGDIVNRRKDGSLYHEEQTIAPVVDPDGKITHFIAIKQDVTERVLAEQALREAKDELARRVAEVEALHAKLREEAIRDPLTGLFNRRYLHETLPRELSSARRDSTPVSVVMIDLDRFKDVNDHHGHATGDAALAHLGRVLASSSRAGDIACRYGGEEFLVVMVGATLVDAARRAEGWRVAFREAPIDGSLGPVRVTLSAGVAEWSLDEAPTQLLSRADDALYRAKELGRDRVCSQGVVLESRRPAAALGTP